MSGRDMKLEVIVRLRDELSRGLDAALGKIRSWAMRTTALFSSIGRGVVDLGQRFSALGIGAGLSLSKGLQAFVEFDSKLRDVAITYGLVGKAVDDYIGTASDKTRRLAIETGQLSQKLLDVRGLLAAANVEGAAAETMLPAIGRASTAAGADTGDITKTAIATFQNAALPPGLLGAALAHMITAGKLGSFELKNMAQHYPSVLAALANLGVKGMEGVDTASAMMQISKRTAGTEGEAATNFLDFLSGLNSAHTVKRFADHGVDLPGLMANANARGINPVEAVIRKIATVIDQPKVVDRALETAKVKGLDPTKTQEEVRKAVEQAVKAAGLGELFVNQQSKLFLMAMLANTSDYRAMKKEIAAADTSVTDADFASRMAGPEAKQRMAGERWEQVLRRTGEALSWVFDAASKAADGLDQIFKAADALSPKLVDLAVNVAAAASGIAGIAGILSFFGRGATGAAAAGGAATVATMATGGATVVASGGSSGSLFGGALGLVGKGAALASRSGTGLLGALLFASEALQQAFPTTKEGMAYRLDAGPVDFATYERAWRAEKEWRADPEGARGRAMMDRRGFTPAPAISRQSLGDVLPDVRIGSPNVSFESITGSKAPDLARMIGAAFAGLLKAAGAKPAAPQEVKVDTKVTVKVDGPGTVTSTQTTQTPIGGDRGQTVGRP